MILYKNMKFEKVIFKMKMIFVKLRRQNLILKYFFKRLEFYKNNFETQFCRLPRFTRKLRYDLYADFWNEF